MQRAQELLDETLRLDEVISVSGLIELVITIQVKINGWVEITLIGLADCTLLYYIQLYVSFYDMPS